MEAANVFSKLGVNLLKHQRETLIVLPMMADIKSTYVYSGRYFSDCNLGYNKTNINNEYFTLTKVNTVKELIDDTHLSEITLEGFYTIVVVQPSKILIPCTKEDFEKTIVG